MNIHTHLAKNRGFTIVESLVAISILVLAITGVSSAIQTGLTSYILSKEQTTAFYLAQEVIEQIKNVRDENVLKGQNWLTGISLNSNDPCYFGNACTIDIIGSPMFNRCPSGEGSCSVINQDTASTQLFGYNGGWTPTTFRREVVLASVDTYEIKITVTIYWSKGAIDRQFMVSENILNWQ